MKSLEENRYRRLVNADARRIAWFVNNNMSEEYETMPKTLMKKWSEAKYGKERFLAKEYLKTLQESKIRSVVQTIIKEVTYEKKKEK